MLWIDMVSPREVGGFPGKANLVPISKNIQKNSSFQSWCRFRRILTFLPQGLRFAGSVTKRQEFANVSGNDSPSTAAGFGRLLKWPNPTNRDWMRVTQKWKCSQSCDKLMTIMALLLKVWPWIPFFLKKSAPSCAGLLVFWLVGRLFGWLVVIFKHNCIRNKLSSLVNICVYCHHN